MITRYTVHLPEYPAVYAQVDGTLEEAEQQMKDALTIWTRATAVLTDRTDCTERYFRNVNGEAVEILVIQKPKVAA